MLYTGVVIPPEHFRIQFGQYLLTKNSLFGKLVRGELQAFVH